MTVLHATSSIRENPHWPGCNPSPFFTATCFKCGDWVADFDHLENAETAIERNGGFIAVQQCSPLNWVVLCGECAK